MWSNLFNNAFFTATGEAVQTLSEQMGTQLSEAFNALDFSVLYTPYMSVLPVALGIILVFAGIGKAIGLIRSVIATA